MEFNRRFNEFGPNFAHIGIFHSNVKLLKANMKKHGPTPFTLLADENFYYYTKYEVERSWSKLIMACIYKTFLIFYAIYAKIAGLAVPGTTGILIAISFFSGALLSTMGIMGIYLARIFEQTKGRTRYVIKNIKDYKK